MKPWIHSLSSAKRYGGKPEDYIKIHDMMDLSKSAIADVRHRAVFHSAFGVFIIEAIFGNNFINSDGKTVSVRDVAEDHVKEDLGTIPTLENWLVGLPIQAWMGGPKRKNKTEEVYND